MGAKSLQSGRYKIWDSLGFLFRYDGGGAVPEGHLFFMRLGALRELNFALLAQERQTCRLLTYLQRAYSPEGSVLESNGTIVRTNIANTAPSNTIQ